ncbi:MAG: hypothetical protein WC346_04570 [Methanogenium sp.]|jgi:hypothetical protein
MEEALISATLDLLTFRIVIGFAIFLIVWFTIDSWLTTRKTKKYRQEIGDMYVTAKIRDIANRESLDLNVEYETFKKWCKKKKRDSEISNYDDVVEDELKEQVEDKLALNKSEKYLDLTKSKKD